MEVTTAERYASGGPGDASCYAQNLALAFQQTVDRLGDDPAIVAGEGDDEVVITWNELARQVAPDRRRAREARRRARATRSR